MTLTVLITGASDGIGAAAARQLAPHGHRLLITGRSRDKLDAVARETGATPFVADYARLDDVRRLAEGVRAELGGDSLDVLANNAGGIFGDPARTVDGHEKTFQVNHLAPFLLTELLRDRLGAAGQASVINTSSVANRLFGNIDLDDLDNERTFTANKAYGDAKLANILHARGLHARYHDTGLSAVAFHPGTVSTNFASETTSLMRFVYQTPLRRLALISPERGGATLAWFIENTSWESGAYYDQRKRKAPNPQAMDDALVKGLWERSASLVGLA
ncbi:SDR family NAD(P)-dependent oxidoreductase [Flaviflexus equikiangi]|uniref:SDR family NAD(P)-dependent oxidoreductase n=1 Tax=Flaviflexus equikiangi TaxID=2758573 RepID=A0ABS2TJ28_9ACTO|nr:SDR family NAD(P)-dependent oxidoreductase [Flaviflexus equikiangi]MBM9434128.1 SDR family NAD(P)-dependent oxidoreductase [Flaviflexus equikiangi]